MKKLKLNLDDLKVESFATMPENAVVGQSGSGTCTGPHLSCPTADATDCVWGQTGCGFYCNTEQATDCPGQGACPPYTEVCHNSYTDGWCTCCNEAC